MMFYFPVFILNTDINFALPCSEVLENRFGLVFNLEFQKRTINRKYYLHLTERTEGIAFLRLPHRTHRLKNTRK